MKNSKKIQNDEIDLSKLLIMLWKNKAKIALITIFSFSVAFVFNNSQQPEVKNTYKYSLAIKPSKNMEFIKLEPILNFINVYQKDTNEQIFDKYLRDLMDYEELISILKNNKKIRENLAALPQNDRQQRLFDYAKLFTIVFLEKPEKNDDILLRFVWHDQKEGINIIEQTLKLTLINFQKSFFNEIEQILEMRKNQTINKDKERVEYLLEQNLIAKELNLPDNTVDSVNLSQQNVSFNFNSNDVAYYLRGYKAIGKEISLIQERKYKHFKYYEDQLKLLKGLDMQWIDYNIFLLEKKLLSEPKKTPPINMMLSIIIGLIIGIFYVFLLQKFKFN